MSFFDIFSQKDINAGIRHFKKTENAVLLDVRTEREYANGHIQGSRNIPLDSISRIDTIVSDKATPLFVHCLSGGRSAEATSYLRKSGYTNVHDIGGINSYRGELTV